MLAGSIKCFLFSVTKFENVSYDLFMIMLGVCCMTAKPLLSSAVKSQRLSLLNMCGLCGWEA